MRPELVVASLPRLELIRKVYPNAGHALNVERAADVAETSVASSKTRSINLRTGTKGLKEETDVSRLGGTARRAAVRDEAGADGCVRRRPRTLHAVSAMGARTVDVNEQAGGFYLRGVQK